MGWLLVLHQPPWSFGFDSQTRTTRENRAPCVEVPGSSGSHPREHGCHLFHPHARQIFASSFSTDPPGDQTSGITDQPGASMSRAVALYQPLCTLPLTFPGPSSPPLSFTQSPSPPRSLVRDGQTSPHSIRLVVSRSTCPPLSPPPTRTVL